jgi:hypothetical protein
VLPLRSRDADLHAWQGTTDVHPRTSWWMESIRWSSTPRPASRRVRPSDQVSATDSDDLVCGTVRKVTVDTFPNLPQLGAEPQRPQAYLNDIKFGFSRAHGYLRIHESEIAVLVGRHTADLRVQVIPRPTFEYDVMLERSLSAGAARSSNARQRAVLRDLRAISQGQPDARGDLDDAEVRSLLGGDIPSVRGGRQ